MPPSLHTKTTAKGYIATAPGSLMLLGEYGVLYGKSALVSAINKRISVRLLPRPDNEIHIHSHLGNYQTNLPKLTLSKPFRFVLNTIKAHLNKLKKGFTLTIESEFSDKVGFGSSAAVTVATLAALAAWLNIRLSARDMVKQARQIVRATQGVGSGADVAASVHGGLVAYQAEPLFVEKFSVSAPLTVLYSGFKTSTPDAIAQVQEKFASSPHLFRQILCAIGQCTLDGVRFVQKNEWEEVGKIMRIQQGLLEALGVSMPILHNLVEELNQQPDILGAKISGSGLGDCVVGLGEAASVANALTLGTDIACVNVAMTAQGVTCEKI